MPITANSYGTAEQVAALTRRYTANGAYTDPAVGPPVVIGTNPTLTTVESWINSVSSTLNVALAGVGFTIPVAQGDAKEAIASIVVEAVADLCHAANSAGRFFTDRSLERGVSPMRVVRQEMLRWVEDQAAGLVKLGSPRPTPDAGQVAFREFDESGDAIHPIFQREGYGNTFKNWDRD